MAKRLFLFVAVLVVALPAFAQTQPVEYTLSFPSPEHRWMQVEAIDELDDARRLLRRPATVRQRAELAAQRVEDAGLEITGRRRQGRHPAALAQAGP